jgi:hypothetical protein
MKLALLALSLLASTPGPTADIQIDVGNTNWAEYPALQPPPRHLPTGAMLQRVETLLRERECVIQGQTYRRFDITVPWIVQVEPNGQVSRLVVADMGCRPLEVYVATLVVALANRGDIRPTAGSETRWYGSEFNFNLTTIR